MHTESSKPIIDSAIATVVIASEIYQLLSPPPEANQSGVCCS